MKYLRKTFFALMLLNINLFFCMDTSHLPFNEALKYLEVPFIESARDGDIGTIKKLIKLGVNVNSKKNNNDTALIWASENGHIQIVKLLLQAGADLEHKNKSGNTALYYACLEDHDEIVSLLVSAGATLENRFNNGNTVLMEAINGEKSKVVEILLKEAKINVNQQNDFGNTPLIEAAQKRDRGRNRNIIFDMLLQAGVDLNIKNTQGRTALICAVKDGHIDIVKSLINTQGINLFIKDNNRDSALSYSKQNNKIIYELIKNKIEEIKKELFGYIENNDLNKIKLFATKYTLGLYDKDGNNPLHIAAKNNNFEVFKLILSIRSNLIGEINNEGKTPLEINSRMIFQFYIDKQINFEEFKNNNK